MTQREIDPQCIICKVWQFCGHPDRCESAGGCEDEDLLVNEILRGAYEDDGIRAWWDRPRAQLDGMTPKEMWKVDRDKVLALAQSLEASNGT